MGLLRWASVHLKLHQTTGFPADEAIGRPDMLVAIKDPGPRYYGGARTIHGTRHLSVETHHGTVVAVWFRCQRLPFAQAEVDGARATEMESAHPDELPRLEGVKVTD